MKFQTIQGLNRFGLTDEARESLSAYLKAPLCSRECSALAAVREEVSLCQSSPGTSLAAFPGSGLGDEELQVTAAAPLRGQSLTFQQMICQASFPFVILQ